MDKRYQVFISSTFTDLKEERRAVLEALLQMDAIPSGMELFPAADEDAWSLIQRMIDDSDYYLLLIGGRYGSVDAEGVSFTEREYDYAVEVGKPIMAFVHGAPDKIEVGKSEGTDLGRERLEAFRSRVMSAKHVRKWTNGPEDLAGQVAFSFQALLKRRPAVGWIRGDTAASAAVVGELNDAKETVRRLESELDEARHTPPAGAEELLQEDESAGLTVSASVEIVGTVMQDGSRLKRFQSSTAEVPGTWNEVFTVVGPLMLQEASERELRRAIDEDLNIHSRAFAAADFMQFLRDDEELDVSEATFTADSLKVESHSFNTILIQFMALGLIARSERAHGVRDANSYWTLTPLGESRLVMLVAKRRVSRADGIGSGVADE